MEFSRKEYWSELPFCLQGIFSSQESNPWLPLWRQTLYHLNHQESQREESKWPLPWATSACRVEQAPKMVTTSGFVPGTSCLSEIKQVWFAAAAAAKSLQSCLTLCNPIEGSPPAFPIPGILQARALEWVAISFSKVWFRTFKIAVSVLGLRVC